MYRHESFRDSYLDAVRKGEAVSFLTARKLRTLGFCSMLLRHRHSRENGNPVFSALQTFFLFGDCVRITASSGFLLPQE